MYSISIKKKKIESWDENDVRVQWEQLDKDGIYPTNNIN